jgi:hypothetical protein
MSRGFLPGLYAHSLREQVHGHRLLPWFNLPMTPQAIHVFQKELPL